MDLIGIMKKEGALSCFSGVFVVLSGVFFVLCGETWPVELLRTTLEFGHAVS